MIKKPQNEYLDEPVVSVTSISKAFGSRIVLKDINFELDRGRGLLICGINGAGKSTLLNIISGLMSSDKGTTKLCGIDIHSEPQKGKTQLGVISHKSILYPELTIFENLLFFANLYDVENARNRVDELIENMGLSAYRYDKTRVLSRGMLQRLAISRAIVHQPAVLLIDEPFTGLDAEACEHLINILDEFRDDGGTLVATSHDIKLGLKCCDRIAVLDKNRFILEAKTNEINTELFVENYLEYARSRN